MKAAIISVIVIFVLGIGGYFFVVNRGDDTDSSNSDESTVDESLTGSVSDLVSKGENLECDFSYTDEYSSQTGTIYIAGARVAGQITADSGEAVSTVNIVRDEMFQYIWGSFGGQSIALKVSLDSIDTTDSDNDEQPDAVESFDFSEDYTFDCSPWTADEEKFELPADQEFTDISEVVPPFSQTISEICNSCDALEGEAREACRTTAGCE